MDIQRWDRAKEKVGNTFELTVLIQKRVRELVREKQRPLVDFEHRNPIQIALEEVLQDKIYLAPPPKVVEAPVIGDILPPITPLSTDPTASPAASAPAKIMGLGEVLDDSD